MDGTDYKGKVKVTINNKKCQNWNSQTPHTHAVGNPTLYPDASLSDAQNYCRNPDNSADGPWCFTLDPDTEWERCDIPLCNPGLSCIFIVKSVWPLHS